MQKGQSGLRGWIRTIADIAVIVLIVLAAKTAIAEPFYVPSGSMEPTFTLRPAMRKIFCNWAMLLR